MKSLISLWPFLVLLKGSPLAKESQIDVLRFQEEKHIYCQQSGMSNPFRFRTFLLNEKEIRLSETHNDYFKLEHHLAEDCNKGKLSGKWGENQDYDLGWRLK